MNEDNEREKLWYFPKARISRAEYLEFVRVLAGLETTCSRFFRKVIREVIGEGPDLLPSEMKHSREVLYQVAAVGRILNQLARAYHTGQPPGLQVDQATFAGYQKQIEQLREDLGTVILRSKHRWVRHE